MDNNNEKASPFTDVNGLVKAFLDDVAGRPTPRGATSRLVEIRRAIDEGNATVDMAREIIELFPYD